jgi:WD40 repeat protein
VTGAAIHEPVKGHTRFVMSLAFLPDGSQLTSSSLDCTIRLWNTATGAALGEPLRHTASVTSVSISGDGKFITSCSDDDTIRVWDATLGAAVGNPLRGQSFSVYSIAFSPGSSVIASRRKATTGKMLRELKRPHGSSHICSLRPRWVSSSRDETIRRWNVAAGEPMAEALRGHNAEVTSVAVSPDGPLIASASCNRTVRILGPRLVPTRRVQ